MCVLAEEVVRRCHTVTPDPPQVIALLNRASSHGIVNMRGDKDYATILLTGILER